MSREKIIEKYLKNKYILDIGCVSNQKTGHFKFARLHEFIRKKAYSVKGLDINKQGAEYMRKKGYDVTVGNAETFKLKEKFDVVVAGELIEHLDNQGAFLKNIRQHLKKNGRIIITTPNSFSFRQTLRNLLGILDVNKEHALWHDKYTLSNIVKRCGFVVEKIAYTFDDSYAIKSKIERLLCFRKNIRPQLVLIARKND